MEQLLGAVKNEKISATVLVVMIVFAYYAMAWANGEHDSLISKDQYQRDQQALSKQLTDLTEAFSIYVDDSTIVAASQLIRDKELQLQIALATGASPDSIESIEAEIEAAKKYRTCLIQQRPNCKHLKPPE